jgi:hypothetical protein
MCAPVCVVGVCVCVCVHVRVCERAAAVLICTYTYIRACIHTQVKAALERAELSWSSAEERAAAALQQSDSIQTAYTQARKYIDDLERWKADKLTEVENLKASVNSKQEEDAKGKNKRCVCMYACLFV